jgi:hypothetical protein
MGLACSRRFIKSSETKLLLLFPDAAASFLWLYATPPTQSEKLIYCDYSIREIRAFLESSPFL